ncbi:MAG: hypothetical protein F6K34_18835 [Okeania sp. SIO4D6]|nr:hypothetical protein [Okeania sp. SIO4D6]
MSLLLKEEGRSKKQERRSKKQEGRLILFLAKINFYIRRDKYFLQILLVSVGVR